MTTAKRKRSYAVRAWLAAALCVGSVCLALGDAAAGGAFNLRVVSDSVPDWSSREHFARSALSGWETDHDRALAQFRWSYRGRTPPAESARGLAQGGGEGAVLRHGTGGIQAC